jgi:hypothetical protein
MALETLQCVADDSGSEPGSPYFVLAGFVSTTGRWAAFSDAWKAELDGGENKCFLPLQAADLYAWNCRRTVRENEVLWMPPPATLARLERLPEISRKMDEAEIIRLGGYLADFGRRLAEQDPKLTFMPYSKGAPKRVRNAKKRAARKAEKPSE